jgi:hypothetical protein
LDEASAKTGLLPVICLLVNESATIIACMTPAPCYGGGMRSRDLMPEQAEKLREQIANRLRYFNRLVERMTKRGFAPGDDLYDAAIRAKAAVHELQVKCHYAGSKHGVGKREEGGWPENVVRRA